MKWTYTQNWRIILQKTMIAWNNVYTDLFTKITVSIRNTLILQIKRKQMTKCIHVLLSTLAKWNFNMF